ncbi:ubiquitin carboxyl-terminal hydrolase 30 homolog [Formica exsecta]|uniref:ubiquitin carboxyl-terminal hydrolase 30 homolog n=1 Tax=Formica exsecta TaxID=72781 RepID=UPI001141DD4F|nr:ubiquitin carboxyl-terminal hydrolase 30 homolog [Formica exsecta]
MDVERIAMFAGVGFAIAVGLFVLWGPSPKPRKKGQVIGINNLGYTCFLNSLLQALAACPTFILWLQRQQEKNRNFADTLLSVLKSMRFGDAVKFLDSGFTTIQGKHKYRLCAVIEHRGPVDSGHFVCFRRGNKTDQWLYTSDIIVESVSLTQVLLASPYLLFYERISGVYPS